jgi:hypothetical protein
MSHDNLTTVTNRRKANSVLNVLFTIDTEVHPINKDWKSDGLQRDIRRDIEGLVDGRCVGLDYELEVLAKNGLKATFMVESLFSAVPEVGTDPLKGIIRRIQKDGHDIQLHLHCEWIPYCPEISIPYRGYLQHYYSSSEQQQLICFASEQLQKCGVKKPIAFRAGGYAADEGIMQALQRAGFKYDTSFYLGFHDKCKLPVPPSLGAPHKLFGVQEIAVAAFKDYPGHFRPAQICACSAREMMRALEQAEKHGWRHFVIVCHSFEMLTGRWQGKPGIRNEVVDRFEELCAYLGRHRDKFRTIGFDDLSTLPDYHGVAPPPDIRGNLINTAGRVFQQALNRIRSRALCL